MIILKKSFDFDVSSDRKSTKKSSITRLDTDEGMLDGHSKCSDYLEGKLRELLGQPANLDPISQQILLAEVSPV